MESSRCVRQSRDGHEAIGQPPESAGHGITSLTGHLERGQSMAIKDKNTKKSMEKKPAQKTLKEKRQAKKAKK